MKILYIEDNPVDAYLLSQSFTQTTPHIMLDSVTTYAGAVMKLVQCTPHLPFYDLVLTDILLPDGNGLSLISFIQERNLRIPVVVITGTESEESAVVALKAGASDYVTKRKDYIARLPAIIEAALHRYWTEIKRPPQPLRVLYAEDDVSDAELTLRHFSQYAPFIQVDIVHSAEEMLKRLPPLGKEGSHIQTIYDVLLLNYHLPSMNGLEILKELREVRNLDIPIVIVTGQGDEELALQVLRLGAIDYAIKNSGYLHRLPWILENAFDKSMVICEQTALKESEERFRGIFENSVQGIFQTTTEGRFVAVNSALANILGFASPEEMIAEVTDIGAQLYVNKEDYLRYTELLREQGMVQSFEVQQYRKDGSIGWVSLSTSVFRDALGNILYYQGIVEDITYKKYAEEALRRSGTMLWSVFEAAPGGIALLTPDRVTNWMNDRMTSIMGRTAEDMKGIDSRVLYPNKEEFARVGRIVFDETKQGNIGATDTKWVHKDGRMLDVHVRAAMIDPKDSSAGIVLTAVDITERKQTEEKIKKAAEEWRTTFDSIKDLIMIVDRDFRITRINKATASFLNLPFDKILGKNCFQLFHGSNRPPGICPLVEMGKTKTHEEVETYIDEKGMWLSTSVDPVLSSEGDIIGAVHIIKDITGRKQAEETVRKSEEKYRNIFENAIEGIFQTTPEGKLISANPSLVCMHGFESLQEMITSINDGGFQIIPNIEDRTKYLSILEEKGFVEKLEIEAQKKDGSITWVSINGHTVKDADNKILYREGIVEDVTDRKRSEEMLIRVASELEVKNIELEETYAELKASHRKIIQQEKMASIGLLAAGVAHEINNPVGFIMSNLNSMGKYTERLSQFISVQSEALDALSGHAGDVEAVLENVQEKKRAFKVDYILDDLGNIVKESLDGAERVKRIVQDLKNFSRVDEAEYKLADVNGGLESTINVVWNELKYKADVKKEYGEIPLTKCNLGQMNQVFMNLLINAAQAIEQRGEISIKTLQNDGHIMISISDTGCGISEDKLNRIFEPFFTTKEVGKGTGLGLSIVYEIVKKHNGDISVESEFGKGTTFTVTIPVVDH